MTVIPGKYRDVEGTFFCLYCAGSVTSADTTCPHCGAQLSAEARLTSKPMKETMSAKRKVESDSRLIECQSCGVPVSEVEAAKNHFKCKACGNMVEPGHDDQFIPTSAPEPTPRQHYTPTPEPRAQEPEQANNTLMYVIFGVVAILVLIGAFFGIRALIRWNQLMSERHPANGYVSAHSWATSYDTLKPFKRSKESDHPMSGENITPYPMVTREAGRTPNPLPTEVYYTPEPGPTEVYYGPERDCTSEEAEPIRKADGSFKIPQCADPTFVPGPTQMHKVVVEPMGDPTIVYENVYPYDLTGMEPGDPLTRDGKDMNILCPDKSTLSAGWQIVSDCHKKYFVTISVGDIDDTKVLEVSETQFYALKQGQTIPVVVNGYGDFAEPIILP